MKFGKLVKIKQAGSEIRFIGPPRKMKKTKTHSRLKPANYDRLCKNIYTTVFPKGKAGVLDKHIKYIAKSDIFDVAERYNYFGKTKTYWKATRRDKLLKELYCCYYNFNNSSGTA